uniref:Putative secreted protein n=1 Tax=Anopheles darlingi TaxID=43151 RepID=A0A2M4DL49_ANODA
MPLARCTFYELIYGALKHCLLVLVPVSSGKLTVRNFSPAHHLHTRSQKKRESIHHPIDDRYYVRFGFAFLLPQPSPPPPN